jgi:L-serine/L-threonine ammonia-lyase
MSLWIETPLVLSTRLSRAADREVWLKMECAQPAGSFKQRGMGLACQRAVEAGARRLISSSGGNAGYAVAWAGRRLQVPVTVVVPSRTSAAMRERIEEEGAEVVVFGQVWDDAHEEAQRLSVQTDGALIHPFDHPDVWAGNATMVAEIARELGREPANVVLSVGGGGLLAGVRQGIQAQGWSSVVWGVETHGAASFAAALAAGKPVRLDQIDTIALTLGAKQVCEAAVMPGGELRSVLVSDADAVAAVERFVDDHRVLVEPACGAALAAVMGGKISGAGPWVVVVCGGASASLSQLAAWRAAVA